MPPTRLSATARNTRKGRRRVTPQGCLNSAFGAQQGLKPVLLEPDAQHFLLRHRDAARWGSLRLAYVLAARPRHLDPVLSARGGEMGGEQGGIAQRA